MTTGPAARRRLRPTRVAGVVLLGLLILEIIVVIAVGKAIGPLWTVLALLATSVLGIWLIKREGARAFQALQQAVQSGRMPARELADGILVLVGGLLLTAPGFVTDGLGVLLVLPFTRPVARNLLTAAIASRLIASSDAFSADPRVRGGTAGPVFPGAGGPQAPHPSASSSEIVEGEIIDDDPPTPPP